MHCALAEQLGKPTHSRIHVPEAQSMKETAFQFTARSSAQKTYTYNRGAHKEKHAKSLKTGSHVNSLAVKDVGSLLQHKIPVRDWARRRS